MRAFIALELPDGVRSALAALEAQLAASKADAKWVSQEQLHVTVRFLGAITDAQQQTARGLLQDVARRTVAFQAALSRPGAFPSIAAPRVVWVGIGEGEAAMSGLAREIEAGLGRAGFPKEDRPFVAHVTLGRVRSAKNLPQLSASLRQTAWTPPAACTIDHVTLFESVLSSAGPTYAALARAPFVGGAPELG